MTPILMAVVSHSGQGPSTQFFLEEPIQTDPKLSFTGFHGISPSAMLITRLIITKSTREISMEIPQKTETINFI